MQDIIYPPCKYCGSSHGMGIEEISNGKIDALDVCSNCLWNPIQRKIIDVLVFDNLEDMKNKLLETEKELLKND